jgi:hypothetical protein
MKGEYDMNSIKKRVLFGLKSFLIIFPVSLLLELLLGGSQINILRIFLITLGFSVGASFYDVFIKVKKSDEMSQNEKVNSAYLSLLMGIVSVPSFPLIIPSVLGIFYAIPGLKSSKRKIALIGIVLSYVGLLLATIFYMSCLVAHLKR